MLAKAAYGERRAHSRVGRKDEREQKKIRKSMAGSHPSHFKQVL